MITKKQILNIYKELPLEALEAINEEDFVKLCNKHLKASSKSYSYINVVYKILSVHLGLRIDDCKEMLKKTCHLMHDKNDGVIKLYSTAEVSRKTLNDFISWIIVFASELGCYIPTPEEYKKDKEKIDNELNKNNKYL